MILKLFQRIFPGDGTARNGITWNLVSLILIGASGIFLNIIIGLFYNPDVIGIFNQVMVFYIVLGQLGVFGLHNALIHFVPKQENDRCLINQLIISFYFIVFIISFLVSTMLFISAEWIGSNLFSSDDISLGLKIVSPAILLFAHNKLFLGIMNSLRHMRIFSIVQGLRYILLITFISLCVIIKAPHYLIMYSFLFSETVLLIMSFIILRFYTRISFKRPVKSFLKDGISFGGRSVFGGIIGELNTKADILVLGVFFSNSVVGIYSFASLLVEGFFSLIVVFRNNMNPLFSKYLHEEKQDNFNKLSKEISLKILPLCIICATGIVFVFWIITLMMPDSSYGGAMFPLIIILLCMSVTSPYIVKSNILTVAGYPELDTLATGLTLGVNFMLNFIFVPFLSMTGAAIATGVSYLIFAIMIWRLIKKKIT